MQKFLFSTLVVVAFGAFVAFKVVLAPPEQRPGPPTPSGFDVPVSVPSEGLISFKHSFAPRSEGSGEHIYRGVMQLPTPCHRLETQTSIAESFPEQIQIYFTIVEHDDICIQRIEAKPFEVSIVTSKEARLGLVMVNGEPRQFAVQEETARVPNPSGAGFTAGEPFVLKLNEERRGEDIAIRFLRVQSDSRCPINADCFWAGEAIAEFEVSHVGVLDEYIPPQRMLLVFPVDESKISPIKSDALFRNFTIHLIGLAPENTTEQSRSLPYEATLVVNFLKQ